MFVTNEENQFRSNLSAFKALLAAWQSPKRPLDRHSRERQAAGGGKELDGLDPRTLPTEIGAGEDSESNS
jgi:hypothetical protein